MQSFPPGLEVGLFPGPTKEECLGSRILTIPLIFTMSIAYLTAESDALHAIFSDPDKFVSATPFEFMLAAIIVLVFGPGKFSLDWLLARTLSPKAVKEKPAA